MSYSIADLHKQPVVCVQINTKVIGKSFMWQQSTTAYIICHEFSRLHKRAVEKGIQTGANCPAHLQGVHVVHKLHENHHLTIYRWLYSPKIFLNRSWHEMCIIMRRVCSGGNLQSDQIRGNFDFNRVESCRWRKYVNRNSIENFFLIIQFKVFKVNLKLHFF